MSNSNAQADSQDMSRLTRLGNEVARFDAAPASEEVKASEKFPSASSTTVAGFGGGDASGGSGSEPECEPSECQQRRGFQKQPLLSGSDSENAAGSRMGQTASDRKMLWRIKNAPLWGISWLSMLRQQYGTSLLLLLFASQHILKGVVQQFQVASVMWLFRDYRVSGPRMQVYMSIANSSWALKPIIGMVSDLVPIKGFNKAPYVIITSCIGVFSTGVIGFSTRDTMSVMALVFCLFGCSLQASTCDLLTEAKYSEHLAAKPAFGPDLLTYVWGGISFGNIIAISLVGTLITTMGPRSVFLACLFPASAIVYPTLMNYFEEKPVSTEERDRIWEHFLKQKEVLWLGLLMCACTVVLTATGALAQSHSTTFWTAIGVVVVLLPTFHLVLRPEIAKVNTFFVLQAALGITINGASFYFYTDKPDQFPEGPHFSAWFFTTTLGLVSAFMSFVGLATYNRFMKEWSYRGLLLLCNCVVTVLCLGDVLMFTRTNLKLGIPDTVFVLGSSVSTIVIRQWQWMPGMVIMSQLCPVGMEATMFALLAGCCNIGNTIADYLGAYVLERLHVHPTGALNESGQFTHLWKASAMCTLLPAITIMMIPYLIPKAKQTDCLLLKNPTSATYGSPLSVWMERRQGAAAAAESAPTAQSSSSGSTTRV